MAIGMYHLPEFKDMGLTHFYSFPGNLQEKAYIFDVVECSVCEGYIRKRTRVAYTPTGTLRHWFKQLRNLPHEEDQENPKLCGKCIAVSGAINCSDCTPEAFKV